MTTTLEARTTRRVTPTAVLVLTAEECKDRPTWLAARRHGLTATDLVAIQHPNDYGTVLSVWADKTDPDPVVDDAASEAAMWGLDFEDPIARRWAELHDVKVRDVGLLAHADEPWMLASLDRLVHGCPIGRCGLEVKTRNTWVANQWDAGVPAQVVTQVQWQMAVSGLDHIHVAALIGGQRLVDHVIDRDDLHITALKARAARTWAAVVAGTMPEIDDTWTADMLNTAFPTREGNRVIDGDLVRPILADYFDAQAGGSAYTRTQRDIRDELLRLLGDGDTAVDDNGVTLFTYKASSSRSVDYTRLEADFPEAYAACVNVAWAPRFNPNKKAVA